MVSVRKRALIEFTRLIIIKGFLVRKITKNRQAAINASIEVIGDSNPNESGFSFQWKERINKHPKIKTMLKNS